MSIPISIGSGAASVAAEVVAGLQYQRIEVLGQGGSSVMAVNPDGSVNVSVIGAITVTGSVIAAGNQSVSGALNISGSVLLGSSNASVISVWQNSSVIAVPTGNQSVSGAINISGSVLLGSSNASVFTIPTGNQSVSGTVGASVFGWVPVQTANFSVITYFQNSSVIAVNAGSVVTVSLGSVITVWKDSSVLAVPVGSTITVFQAPSIVGTYAEDAPSASGDKGFLVMGARNDTLASVTSADGDYSSHVVGPAGELIAENAPLTKWVQGTADFRQGNAGASIVVIAAQGSSVFTYVTGLQVANMGSASVLVTLAAGGSTLGYTIAPAGGGSNVYYQNALKTPANFGFAASTSGIASVLISAQGFISKT